MATRDPDGIGRRIKVECKMSAAEWRAYVEIQDCGSVLSYGTPWGDQMESAVRDWFARQVSLPASVLDVGCGEGRGVATLSELGFEAAGVDLCEAKVLRGRARGLNLSVDDFHELGTIATDAFDYVFASHCLEHALDQELALRAITRVARAGVFYIIPIWENEGENAAHTSCVGDPCEFLGRVGRLGLRHESFERHRLSRELFGVIHCEMGS